ncbi:uncharacterized protein LOC119654895 [Hermetia illucens]|uniref:uncharacterized protein LOC119654895 n=1 Tax=Hermetia illucens TaxID=343691 RepID=UPI0018CC3E87|nr:uncharacterized protein LOC119654895 [Hermetia illucens]
MWQFLFANKSSACAKWRVFSQMQNQPVTKWPPFVKVVHVFVPGGLWRYFQFWFVKLLECLVESEKRFVGFAFIINQARLQRDDECPLPRLHSDTTASPASNVADNSAPTLIPNCRKSLNMSLQFLIRFR